MTPGDGPWGYASDALTHVEANNCAKGCQRGLADPARFVDCGPGGSCDLLAALFTNRMDEDIPEFQWVGDTVLCSARQPL